MKHLLAGTLIPGALAVVGIVAVLLWTSVGPMNQLEARVPGLDRPKLGEEPPAKPLVGTLTTFNHAAPKLPGAWPRFRGERFDGIAQPGEPLARHWPDGGPAVLWSIELGEGYAGAAVRDGRVYRARLRPRGLGRRAALPLAGRRTRPLADSPTRSA